VAHSGAAKPRLETTAAVCDSVCIAVNHASATSYNYDAPIAFLFIAQQSTTSDAVTINISFSVICTQLLYN